MNDIIIVKKETNKYFINYIKDKYNINELYSNELFYHSFMTYIPFIQPLLLNKWKHKLKEYNKLIIFDTMYSKHISEYIKRINPNIKIYLYYWNKINDNNKRYLDDKNIYKIYTFDKKDSKKYKINYNPQFYSYDIKLKKNKIKYDIFFIGRDKGRLKYINDLEDKFKELGLSTNIIIIDKESDFIYYDKYLDLLSKSNVILDIVSDNQKGLSMRVMESIFLNKKIITNNTDIINYDFYNPNNIFILGKDDINKLDKFINSKYIKVSKDILNNYNIDEWIKRFN